MVCVPEEAFLESAGLAVRPGVVGALRDDGSRRVACVEAGRIRGATPVADALPCATGAQRCVDAAVLRAALDGHGLRRNHAALAGNCRDDCRLSSRQPRRRVAACALFGVGKLRRWAELYLVAIELLNFPNANDDEPFNRAPPVRHAGVGLPAFDHKHTTTPAKHTKHAKTHLKKISRAQTHPSLLILFSLLKIQAWLISMISSGQPRPIRGYSFLFSPLLGISHLFSLKIYCANS
jgi:hypothetical protein